MNTQEIFDKVASHLLTQNVRSPFGGSCLYRAPNGNMCAVGCLISKEVYDAQNYTDADDNVVNRLEGAGIRSIRVRGSVEDSIGRTLDDPELRLLMDLQGMHDRLGPEDWPARMQKFADRYDLSNLVVVEYTPQKEKEEE